MLFSIVKYPDISANDLNHYQRKLEFNPNPFKHTTEVLNNVQNHPQCIFNGTVVTKAEEQKHLGFILESNLSFDEHLSEKIWQTKKHIDTIKHLSRFLPLKMLDKMYKTFVCLYLGYYLLIYLFADCKTLKIYIFCLYKIRRFESV